MLAHCPICNSPLPLARVWWRARTIRGVLLRETTGVVCSRCGERWVIAQERAVVVGFVSLTVGGFASGMGVVGLQNLLHHRLTDAQIILSLLVLLAPLAWWQFRIVPLFCRVRPKLHPTGLHPNSLAALVLDFMASNRLGLLGLAAAADVVAANCRHNEWVLTHVKPASLNEAQWVAFLEGAQAIEDACKAAMTAFGSNGSMEALCAQFLDVASALNDRILPTK